MRKLEFALIGGASILIGALMGVGLVCMTTALQASPIAPDKVDVTDFNASAQPGEQLATQLMHAPSFIEAVIITRPHMYDKVNEIDGGTYLLAAWSAKHLTFNDVTVTKNQTNLQLITHDLPGQLGKRFCDTVLIMQVDPDPFIVNLYRGLAVSESFGQIAFLSVGNKPQNNHLGRWCGVFTGNYRYTYDAGLGLAIKSIGMFEASK